MKNLIVLAVVIITIGAVFNSTTNKQPQKHDVAKENGQNVSYNSKPRVQYSPSMLLDTSGRIPTFTNFYDYRTNGNNLRLLWVLGDTIIAASDLVDSANCQVSTARKSYYQVSTNGGVTWLPDAILVAAQGSAYPDLCPVIISGSRSIADAGRLFVSGTRHGMVAVDVVLGAGSFTVTDNGGQDNFAMNLSPTLLACGYESTSTDTLYSARFNATNNQFTNKVFLAGSSDGIAANTRSFTGAGSNKVVQAWWDPTAGDMWARISSDGGLTYAAKVQVLSSTAVINGDPVCSWFGADAMVSPGGNPMVATNTLEPGFFGTVRGSKLIFWSPAINSGNPVVIVDWHNASTNAMISDTTYYSNHYSPSFHQVGLTALSHPSLAYSSDGTRLFCVYSVVQKDTSSYGFFYNDICESYSDNNGATWSSPVILKNTPLADEIYPTVSKTGCTPTNIAVTYQLSECPGSTSFTNTTTPACKVYNIFKRFNPVTGAEIPIGIVQISSEVPDKFSLEQNYPNPFNPSTKIRFAMPKADNVTIRVYNSVGQIIATLAHNERVEAGINEVTFDASRFASGIYFYTLETVDFKASKKMIFVK